MKTSSAGVAAIKSHEGLRLTAYPDPGSSNGLPVTIGHGSTTRLDGSPWNLGDTISEVQADELLRRDLQDAERAVNELVRVPLSQAQFDALVSFVFNVGAGAFGASTMLRLLNAGDYAGAAEQFDRWINNDGQPLEGLRRRRQAERAMFMSVAAQPTTPEDKPMLGTIVAAVVPELLKVLPWYSSGSESAERNLKTLNAIAPTIIEAAKVASGKTGAAEAADVVLANPASREQFVREVAVRWPDIAPMLEFDEGSRGKARDFADRMTGTGPEWRQIGYGILVTAAGLAILGLFGALSWQIVFDPATSATLKERIIDKWDLFAAAVVFFIFGSSVGSRAKDNGKMRQS